MSDFRMSFDPLFSWWVIFAVSASAFAFFAWLELKRKQTLFIPRVIALILILISLLALLLRPSFKAEKKSEAILLTLGFEKTKVDSLLRLEPQLKIFRLADTESYPHSEVLGSIQSLSDKSIKYIFGEGVADYIFDLMGARNFQFVPCRLPFGIVELTVPKVFPKRKNSISGSFNSSGSTKLKLVGPSGVEDSVRLNKGSTPFTLSFRPEQSGLFIYNLMYEDHLGNKSSERLPIEVVEEHALKILFIQKFPSVEMRFLKNFLTGKGHAIAIRTQTSKNNFNEEFINFPKTRLNQFTHELLDSFDLLLIDSKTTDELTENEKSILKKSVFDGLGLVVLQNSVPIKPDFYFIKGKNISNDTVHLSMPGIQRTFSVLPVKVIEQPSVESVIKSKDRVLAGYRFYGAGKIAFQFLQETYRLELEGNSNDYAFIWTPLIEKSSRKRNKKFELKLINPFPYYPNESLKLSVLSSGEKPAIRSDDIKVPASEDVLLDDYWKTKSWAGKSGWHRFTANDSTTLNYFVSEPSEWKSLRIASQVKNTLLAQSALQTQSSVPQFENEKISPLIFYLTFILASGFLWLAPKI
ncbi:MAG: hypothetical protein HY015_11175 [Bacteroidetes bacterium]|nr:hypothetical protein [Bacteroidota bacterium]MBI3483512.1 hypothetical protein [Bacteroidota bacterium]